MRIRPLNSQCLNHKTDKIMMASFTRYIVLAKDDVFVVRKEDKDLYFFPFSTNIWSQTVPRFKEIIRNMKMMLLHG